jgi:macrolide transport system ATP-binding/permease protein
MAETALPVAPDCEPTFDPTPPPSPHDAFLIDACDLTRIYRMGDVDVPALDHASLRVQPGEFVAITGASGSGKSTLLSILGCLDRADSGAYRLGGRDVANLADGDYAAVRNHQIGFVFQGFNLLPRTSAVENVELPLRYADKATSPTPRRNRGRRALEMVGLIGHEEATPTQLSGGEQQRVAIARAIVMEPSLLLADEPTGNLDAKSADAVLAVLQKLHDAGKTIIMVTHEPSIAACAGRVIRMRDGRIVADERQTPRVAQPGAAPVEFVEKRPETRWQVADENLPQAFQSLLRHRMRSLLTMLGVLIGVGGVIAMLALGAGTTESIETSVASLGTNLILLMPGVYTQSGARLAVGQSTLTPADADAIATETETVGAVSPIVVTSGQAVAGETNWGTSIQGVGSAWSSMRAWSVAAGTFFAESDVVGASRVCVLGGTVAENLFPAGSAEGQRVRIRNVPFRVVGVLERKGSSLTGRDQDDLIVIPYTTVMRQLLRSPRISVMLISARDRRMIPQCEAEVAALMRQRHRIFERDDDFTLVSQQEVAAAARQTTGKLSFLLSAIATIALVVGGIGITNIMLVTVTERTREIGLRLAVGARPGQILNQFLAEALTLSLAGGLLGVLLGVTASTLISRIGGWATKVQPAAIAVALGAAALVGVLSGLYPARRASRLEPMVALRSE